VVTLGFLVYSKYASKSPSSTLTQATTTPLSAVTPTPLAAATPTSTPASAIVQLTSNQVVSPALFFNGTGITYFDNQGNLYQANLQNNNGQFTLTGNTKLDVPAKPGVTKILWPSKGNDFIAEISNGTSTTYSYFNSVAATYTDLPPQVESLDWMPNGTQIMYIWLQNGKSSLSLGSPDTKTYQSLAPMWENDDQLSVSPDGSQALYFETNNAGANNFINSVSADGKIFKGLVKNGQNYGVLWSPDGQKFLFGKKDPQTQEYQIWYDNLTSGEVENLGLFTTVDKAVWGSDSNTIYAAVPNSEPSGGNSLTVDSFYKMDTTTLNKTQYQSSATTSVDGENLFLSSTGDKLFFKNAQDGGLYYLDLTQAQAMQQGQ
jgi:hypothetical protein